MNVQRKSSRKEAEKTRVVEKDGASQEEEHFFFETPSPKDNAAVRRNAYLV